MVVLMTVKSCHTSVNSALWDADGNKMAGRNAVVTNDRKPERQIKRSYWIVPWCYFQVLTTSAVEPGPLGSLAGCRDCGG